MANIASSINQYLDFFKVMGGIPVDKSKPGSGLTDIAIKNMKRLNGSLIAMAPEGTRAKTEKMKSGFLRIANAVEVKFFWCFRLWKKKDFSRQVLYSIWRL